MPKVSVIIPTYNRAHLLPRAIKSVLNQMFKDFELIIVDDGSTDNTREVVEGFQKKDPRVKYSWKENSGCPAGALNFGISHCEGLYIAFCASDDEWDLTYLDKQMSIFNSDRNIDITSTNLLVIGSDGRKITEISKPKTTDNQKLIEIGLERNYIFGNVVIRKEILDKVGLLDENLRIREDFDLWMRIAKSGFNFKFVYEPLWVIHHHLNQISASIGLQDRTSIVEYLIDKHKDLYLRYPAGHAKTLRNLGTYHMLAGQIEQARKCFIKSIKLQPMNLRHYINLILSFFGQRLFSFLLKIKKQSIFGI
jgi:glycosyltransferase involved in cell wall biosynthesis